MQPSWPPQQHYGSQHPPPYGPPPKKSSKALIIVIALVTVTFGSCASWCGYQFYKAQTPEGQRAYAEEKAKDEANLVQVIEKLGRIRKNLPTKLDAEVRCAKKTDGFTATVDSVWLDTLGKPEAEWDRENLAAFEKLRWQDFSDRMLIRAAEGPDAGTADAGIHFFTAALDAKQIADRKQMYVLAVDTMTAPLVSGQDWAGGSVKGALVVVDYATEKPLCQTPISAENSAQVSVGGGVRIKVRGIPSPTMGDTGLKEAVEKDFTKNVETALREGAKRIGAS